MKILLYSSIFIFFSLQTFAQVAGESVYPILTYPITTTQAQLGGYNFTVKNSEPATSFMSPSLLDSSLHNSISTGFSSIFTSSTDIGLGYISYTRCYKKNTYSIGAVMLNYGKFSGFDESANPIGTVYASDYFFQLSAARPIHRLFTVGANVKPIISSLSEYSSLGIVTDIAVTMD
ncbi:MAG: hypothetical protein SNJ71_02580, partial [Bacteroidales bacterium]